HPNQFGMAASLGFLFFMSRYMLFKNENGWGKNLAYLAIGLASFILVISSGSRGSFLSVFVGSLVYFVVMRKLHLGLILMPIFIVAGIVYANYSSSVTG